MRERMRAVRVTERRSERENRCESKDEWGRQ